MAADETGALNAAPAAGLESSQPLHRSGEAADASGEVVRAVVSARAERQALLVRLRGMPCIRCHARNKTETLVDVGRA